MKTVTIKVQKKELNNEGDILPVIGKTYSVRIVDDISINSNECDLLETLGILKIAILKLENTILDQTSYL